MDSKEIKLTVDNEDLKVWIHDGHQQVEFYSLDDTQKESVFKQIEHLDKQLDKLKSYTGYIFKK